ncbi:hypothetical protein ACRALDRAFT_1093789 [Sodiomyces alcalophilus JCM 7366]|uniref:uncharacterized protein n=1 Tax=Sodiomyces alcalophilus JCM 7366 TaxID=591952 RepID=UPI0039B53B0F
MARRVKQERILFWPSHLDKMFPRSIQIFGQLPGERSTPRQDAVFGDAFTEPPITNQLVTWGMSKQLKQIEEREVLESIFPDEITEISATEFRIKITLDLVGHEEEDDPPTMFLHVRYPEAYPDEPPILDIQAPPNTVPSPHLPFSVAEDKAQLLEALEVTIQENLGMAMVFTLVTTLKDAAEQLVADREAAQEKAREEIALAAEREENKKFQGTAVNRETFLRWRESFLREMEEKRLQEEEERLAELKKTRIKEPVKLTGRQLWEKGLAGKGDADEGDGEDGISEAKEQGILLSDVEDLGECKHKTIEKRGVMLADRETLPSRFLDAQFSVGF